MIRASASVRRRILAVASTILIVSGAAGCSDHEFEPPDREARVAEAERVYSEALFDSVSWASDSARALAGNSVYASECRQCHGTLGGGSTPYADERDLDVPSLVEEEWEMAGDVEAVRRRTFTGHPEGMPTWGMGRLTPRQIDAAAYYVVEQLRPDVLEGRASVPEGPSGEG